MTAMIFEHCCGVRFRASMSLSSEPSTFWAPTERAVAMKRGEGRMTNIRELAKKMGARAITANEEIESKGRLSQGRERERRPAL